MLISPKGGKYLMTKSVNQKQNVTCRFLCVPVDIVQIYTFTFGSLMDLTSFILCSVMGWGWGGGGGLI